MQVCYKCKNFQIRYSDPINKYGCKALGFKSQHTNWNWLIMPCPCYEENPLRLKNAEGKQEKINPKTEDSDKSKNGKSKLNIIV